MKKSKCYMRVKDKEGEITFIEKESQLEILTDSEGHEFRIHYCKSVEGNGKYWSATEESTGLRISGLLAKTRAEARSRVLERLEMLHEAIESNKLAKTILRVFKKENGINENN